MSYTIDEPYDFEAEHYGLSAEQEARIEVLRALVGQQMYRLADREPAEFAASVAAVADPLVAWVLTGKTEPAEPTPPLAADGTTPTPTA